MESVAGLGSYSGPSILNGFTSPGGMWDLESPWKQGGRGVGTYYDDEIRRDSGSKNNNNNNNKNLSLIMAKGTCGPVF